MANREDKKHWARGHLLSRHFYCLVGTKEEEKQVGENLRKGKALAEAPLGVEKHWGKSRRRESRGEEKQGRGREKQRPVPEGAGPSYFLLVPS